MKIKKKQVPKLNSETTPWEHYRDNRESSWKKQEQQVKSLHVLLGARKDADGFQGNLFQSDASYDQVKNYLVDVKKYKNETIRSYLSSLCKYLEKTPGLDADTHSKFFKLQLEYAAKCEQDVCDNQESKVDFEQLIPIMRAKLADPEVNRNVRILCAMIISDINDQDEPDNNNGVLRPSDLMATKFVDDGDHSFLDMEKQTWLIRSNHTKNKKERSLNIPRFTKHLKEIFVNEQQLPPFLICTQEGEKMAPSSTSEVFKKTVGYTLLDCRSSYVTYRTKKGMLMCERSALSLNMGHKIKTAITYYQKQSSE